MDPGDGFVKVLTHAYIVSDVARSSRAIGRLCRDHLLQRPSYAYGKQSRARSRDWKHHHHQAK